MISGINGLTGSVVDKVYLAALPLRSKVNSKSLVLLFGVTLALSSILNQAQGPNSEVVRYFPWLLTKVMVTDPGCGPGQIKLRLFLSSLVKVIFCPSMWREKLWVFGVISMGVKVNCSFGLVVLAE